MRLIIFTIINLLIIGNAFAANINNIAGNFSKDFISIEKQIDKGFISKDKHDDYEKKLRIIKKTATENTRKSQEFLKIEQELLSALGPEPEANSTDETYEIKKKRKNLLSRIRIIVGEIKSSQLNIAKAEELIKRLAGIKKEVETSKLFKHIHILYNKANLNEALSQTYIFLNKSFAVNDWAMLVAIISAIIFGSLYLVKQTKLYTKKYNISSGRNISIRLALQIIVSSLVIISFRFHIIETDHLLLFRALMQLIFGSILAASLFELLGCFTFRPSLNSQRNYSNFKNRVLLLLKKLSLVTIVISFLGYTELSSFIIVNILGSILAVLFFIFARNSVIRTKKIIQENRHLQAFGAKEKLSPLTIVIFEPLLALLSIGIMMFFWGITSHDFAIWLDEYRRGIPIGSFFINFQDLGTAIFLFITIISISKIIQWFLEWRVFKHTNWDIGLQNTIITIIGYIGIIIALLTSFSILGVNMENIAIVAGALSVGIGFGLQTIFNNFVSGLILLFERPFKVGDWVTVGEHQGIVKKIKVRSTELETFSQISLIIPNSLMISDAVSNWTLHDRIGRADIAIGVAYGSDTELVKNILLECAKNHKDVCSYPEPNVLFMGFGDSSLDFELRCFLVNIENRLSISSELRFKIDKLFRENNIEIPFPQRDLHIKTNDNTLS